MWMPWQSSLAGSCRAKGGYRASAVAPLSLLQRSAASGSLEEPHGLNVADTAACTGSLLCLCVFPVQECSCMLQAMQLRT
jgi:hypothetical protein